jgi:hypothetical protein
VNVLEPETACKCFVSVAFVAVTVQLTAEPGVTVVATLSLRVPELYEHPVPVTLYVTAPDPLPPVVARTIPAIPLLIFRLFELEIDNVACAPLLIVMFALSTLVAAMYVAFPACDAVMMQVPAITGRSLPETILQMVGVLLL